VPGVQFRGQIDMNGLPITELAPGVAGTDAVNVNQLTASGPQGYAQTIGDGTNTTFTVTHNFSTLDVMVAVIEVSTGAHIITTVVNNGVNTVQVTFGTVPTTNQYRVLVIPVP
jgi:hypothetical protein